MGHKARVVSLVSVIVLVFIMLFRAAYHQLHQNSQQAEAKLMMSFVHTLQRVYKLEHRQYISWDDFYGAMLAGVDRCEQPEGAAALGFLIPGCHRGGAPIPRYAYRVRLESRGDRYTVEARSGSDRAGLSFVCFDPHGEDRLESSQNLSFNQTKSCP